MSNASDDSETTDSDGSADSNMRLGGGGEDGQFTTRAVLDATYLEVVSTRLVPVHGVVVLQDPEIFDVRNHHGCVTT